MGSGLAKRNLEREKAWRKTVEEWQASGLLQSEFCREKGIRETPLAVGKRLSKSGIWRKN